MPYWLSHHLLSPKRSGHNKFQVAHFCLPVVLVYLIRWRPPCHSLTCSFVNVQHSVALNVPIFIHNALHCWWKGSICCGQDWCFRRGWCFICISRRSRRRCSRIDREWKSRPSQHQASCNSQPKRAQQCTWISIPPLTQIRSPLINNQPVIETNVDAMFASLISSTMARLFGQQQTAIFGAGRRGQVVVAAGRVKWKQNNSHLEHDATCNMDIERKGMHKYAWLLRSCIWADFLISSS